MTKESVLKSKSYEFAIRIVRLSDFLRNEKKEYTLCKQILRSGTAVGALISEAEFAQSNSDYIHKFSVALKEANETLYWLSLLKDTNYIDLKLHESMSVNCKELISILVATIKTLKAKTKNK